MTRIENVSRLAGVIYLTNLLGLANISINYIRNSKYIKYIRDSKYIQTSITYISEVSILAIEYRFWEYQLYQGKQIYLEYQGYKYIKENNYII